MSNAANSERDSSARYQQDGNAALRSEAGSDTRTFLIKLGSLLTLDQRHLHVMDEIRLKNWALPIQQQLNKLADAQPKQWGLALDHARRTAEKDFKDARDMLIWGPRGLGLQGQQVDAEAVHAFSEGFEIIHKLEELYTTLRDDIDAKQDAIGNDGMTGQDERGLDRARQVRDTLRRFIDGPVPSFSELNSALEDLIAPPVLTATPSHADKRTLN